MNVIVINDPKLIPTVKIDSLSVFVLVCFVTLVSKVDIFKPFSPTIQLGT